MFFLNRFLVCFNLFVLFFFVIPYLIVAVQPCMEWIPIRKNAISVKGKYTDLGSISWPNSDLFVAHIIVVIFLQYQICLLT